MDTFQRITFANPMSFISVLILFSLLIVLFWFLTGGLRQFLARKNYILLFVIQTVLFIAFIVLLNEPQIEEVQSRNKKNNIIILIDGSKSTRLRQESPWTLVYQKQNPFLTPNSKFKCHYFLFGEELRKINPGKIEIPKVGDNTFIYRSIKSALGQFNKQDQNIIYILSDGQDFNLSGNDIDELKSYNVPIYCIGIGSKNNLSKIIEKDLKVNKFIAPKSAPFHSNINLKVEFSVLGQATGSTKVEFFSNGTLLGQKKVNLIEGKKNYKVIQNWKPQSIGGNDLSVKITGLSGEKNLLNNIAKSKVSIWDQSDKALLVRGGLNWEGKFLRRLINSSHHFQLDVITYLGRGKVLKSNQKLSKFNWNKEDLFNYGLIILDDLDPEWFSPQKLATIHEFVTSRGATILFLVNQKFSNLIKKNIPEKLSQLLPINIDKSFEVESRKITGIEINPSSADHPLFNFTLGKNRKYEGQSLYFLGKSKETSTVLLQGIENSEIKKEGFLHMNFGKGNVFYSSFGTTWKWFLDEEQKRFYELLWGQIISQSLNQNNNKQAIVINSPSNQYIKGEKVKIFVDVPVKLASSIKKEILIKIITPNKKDQTLKLVKKAEGDQVRWQASLYPKDTGSYQAIVQHEIDRKVYKDKVDFHVIDDNRESEYLFENESLLRLLSSSTNGSYKKYDEFIDQPFSLKAVEDEYSYIKRKPFWSSNTFIGIILSLLAINWIFRRSIQLD